MQEGVPHPLSGGGGTVWVQEVRLVEIARTNIARSIKVPPLTFCRFCRYPPRVFLHKENMKYSKKVYLNV